MTLKDLHDMLKDLPDVGDSASIERIDTARGFVRENLFLRQKGKPVHRVRRGPPQEDIQAMLDWLVERQFQRNFKDGTPEITESDVLMIYAQQQGRCAVTGVPLVLDKAMHPESLTITRRDPAKSWNTKNTIVVAFAIKPFVDNWGVNYLAQIAKRVVKHQQDGGLRSGPTSSTRDRLNKKKEGK